MTTHGVIFGPLGRCLSEQPGGSGGGAQDFRDFVSEHGKDVLTGAVALYGAILSTATWLANRREKRRADPRGLGLTSPQSILLWADEVNQ